MARLSLPVFAFICIALIAVPVAAAPPTALFSASPTNGPAPLNVSFTDASSDSPTGWAWYFGDEDYASKNWTRQTQDAGWYPRSRHSSVVLPDGSIVLMGGYSSGYLSDVWRSIDAGATWTRRTLFPGWSGREWHSSVALPDGCIVLMGGLSNGTPMNDVWMSSTKGITWSQKTANASWSCRLETAGIALPDGSIVLMGGRNGTLRLNDVWRSVDHGATWTQQTAAAPWSGRDGHTSVVLPDGSIVLMGGFSGGSFLSDVWRSTDSGVTWNRQTASAPWLANAWHTSGTLPDGSILLVGSYHGATSVSDIWRSSDKGVTWTQLPAAPWAPRVDATGNVLPDGSFVLMGGGGTGNDVWRLETASSSSRDPFHTYATPGNYTVSLRVRNPARYADTIRREYVTVTDGPVVLAVPPGSALPMDTDGDRLYDDVNGNDRKDFADTVLFFNQLSWIEANEPVPVFDYSGNRKIDFADVVWLFKNLDVPSVKTFTVTAVAVGPGAIMPSGTVEVQRGENVTFTLGVSGDVVTPHDTQSGWVVGNYVLVDPAVVPTPVPEPTGGYGGMYGPNTFTPSYSLRNVRANHTVYGCFYKAGYIIC